MLGEVREAYSWVGLKPRFAFATKPDKAIGDPALWERAEALIKEALDRAGGDYKVKPKDGTFYAPKIDIYIDDALGREWQMATIQVDLTMLPERFDLTYIDEQGQPQRPIAIHRAIYGSLERFIGILVEHFAGAFPLWLAPVQAVVIPIADRHIEAARRAGRRSPGARAAGRRRRLRQPDAEQDPRRPGAEGPVHARPRRPRDRGADGIAADAVPAKQQPQETLGWDALADRLAAERRVARREAGSADTARRDKDGDRRPEAAGGQRSSAHDGVDRGDGSGRARLIRRSWRIEGSGGGSEACSDRDRRGDGVRRLQSALRIRLRRQEDSERPALAR